MDSFYHKIPRFKAEMPLYVMLFFVWLFGSMIIYSFVDWYWNIPYAILIYALLALLRKKGVALLNKDYFIKADNTGVAYQVHIFSKETTLIWEVVADVDILMHEINFRLAESRAVSSLGLSSMNEAEIMAFKKYIYTSFHAFKKD